MSFAIPSTPDTVRARIAAAAHRKPAARAGATAATASAATSSAASAWCPSPDQHRSTALLSRVGSSWTPLGVCYDARMPYYGQITGTDNGVEGSWFIELNDDGGPEPKPRAARAVCTTAISQRR